MNDERAFGKKGKTCYNSSDRTRYSGLNDAVDKVAVTSWYETPREWPFNQTFSLELKQAIMSQPAFARSKTTSTRLRSLSQHFHDIVGLVIPTSALLSFHEPRPKKGTQPIPEGRPRDCDGIERLALCADD